MRTRDILTEIVLRGLPDNVVITSDKQWLEDDILVRRIELTAPSDAPLTEMAYQQTVEIRRRIERPVYIPVMRSVDEIDYLTLIPGDFIE